MLKKENFKGEYASTELEPTKEEIEYTMSIINKIDVSSNQYSDVQGDTGCECEDEIWMYPVSIPFLIEDFEEERVLWILYCPECHSWQLCD